MNQPTKAMIEQDAIRAAKAGRSHKDACPYPFKSDEGMHWLAVWILNGGQA